MGVIFPDQTSREAISAGGFKLELPFRMVFIVWPGANGTLLVEVIASEKLRSQGIVFPIPGDRVMTSENELICIREGNKGYIGELRMGAVGESAKFAIPHGVIVRATIVAKGKHSANTQYAEARMSIVHVPVK